MDLFCFYDQFSIWDTAVHCSATVICLSALPCCVWDLVCVCTCVHVWGEEEGVVSNMKNWKMQRWKGSEPKRQAPSAQASQHVPITAALKQSPARRCCWPILRAGGDARKEIWKRGKWEGVRPGGTSAKGRRKRSRERGWKADGFKRDWERGKRPMRASTTQKVRTWERTRVRRGTTREKAAGYSEPLLEMINQQHWAELTSRGPVCKFSSCPNNPPYTHTHTDTHTYTDKTCVSFIYSFGNLKISDLFRPAAPSTLCSSSKLKISPVNVHLSCFKIKASLLSKHFFSSSAGEKKKSELTL